MKNIIKKAIEPSRIIGFFLFNLGMGLLIYVFICHLEDTPLAYLSYLLSFYALIIFCIWFYKACKFSNAYIKNNSKLYKMYHNNTKTIEKTSLAFSLLMNLIYGLFKLVFGIYYQSEWFITFAIYYLLLCFMKLSLIEKKEKRNSNKDLSRKYKKLKNIGITLLLLDFVLSGMIVLITKQNQTITYPGYLIYIVALYDFYLIISAFINVLKYRNKNNPMIVSSKCISLTVAMISMISLEVAMIYQFGNNDTNFKLIMTASMGFTVCLINSFMAVYIIIRANQKLKKS